MHRPQPFFEVDAAKIRKKRMAEGLETEELAERARISRRYVSHLENGTRHRLGPARYKRLKAALNADETELLLAPTPRTDHPKE